jgi:hypothetical protein
MSVRVRYGLSAAISSSSSESKDLGNGSYEVVDDTQGEGGGRKVTLVASVVDAPIAFCDVADAKFLLVRTTPKNPNNDCHEIKIRLNGIGADEISIKPLGTSKEGYFLITTTGLVSLHATNMGATDMSLTLFVAGD